MAKRDKSVGIEEDASSSYNRDGRVTRVKYNALVRNFLRNKEMTVSWLMDTGMMANERDCRICKKKMSLSPCRDRKDGMRWECRRSLEGKRHRCERSIRERSWFEGANLTISEVLKFTYWWCAGLNQVQINVQLGMAPSTLVDWDMFCRELCGVVLSSANAN